MYKNEKGITLIELLATIVIAFFAMGIIYSVLMLAINYFNTETTKTRLQQEANYIITELQRVHRAGECYTLSISETQVVIGDCQEESSSRTISSGFQYNVDYFSKDRQEIEPAKENVTLEGFSVSDPENNSLEVTLSTIISRYQNLDPNEEEVDEE